MRLKDWFRQYNEQTAAMFSGVRFRGWRSQEPLPPMSQRISKSGWVGILLTLWPFILVALGVISWSQVTSGMVFWPPEMAAVLCGMALGYGRGRFALMYRAHAVIVLIGIAILLVGQVIIVGPAHLSLGIKAIFWVSALAGGTAVGYGGRLGERAHGLRTDQTPPAPPLT